MATLQNKIVEEFLKQLRESKNMDANKVDQLRKLLIDAKKKPKAQDLVKLFSQPAGGDLE